MNQRETMIYRLEQRVEYLEEVNLRIRSSLDTLRSLTHLQEKIEMESGLRKICKQSADHIVQMVNLSATAFLVFEEDALGLELVYLNPWDLREETEEEVARQIDKGTFSYILRENTPTIVPSLMEKAEHEIILCPLSTENRVVGMFFGVLNCTRDQVFQESLDFLSIALRSTSLGLENVLLAQEVLSRKATLEVREGELRKSHDSLRKAMEGIINIVSMMAEIRDPYTADHQRRVARLATAIAREMGLDEHQVEGVRIACLLHDIGKVQVPTEILSKPGRLTEIEFMLIKTHSQVGYDILKTIEFPWPIADIILQHHERVDGSGYPKRLKGDDMLFEAKILAVADVVEAVCSHRPYRPALGLEKAIEAISDGRGTLFDEKVVDACCRVVVRPDFSFE